MELDRKAFHFDLDNESVERFYNEECDSRAIETERVGTTERPE